LVVLTKKAAEAALPSLLGMGLDYAPSFDRHDVRRKVGVITRADIVGRNLELGGHLFAKDFPEIVAEIAKSGRGELQGRVLAPLGNKIRPALGTNPEPGKEWSLSRATETGSWKSSLAAALGRILAATTAMAHLPNEQGSENHPTLRAESRSASGTGLGMSYELTDVQLADTRARVWLLTKVTFTGAAILRRDKAAYRDTWIELSS
jgi:hypothetical protein